MEQFWVKASWDAKAGVWYVADSNVPGLATEAETVEGLADKLRVMVPELLEENAAGARVPAGEAPAVHLSARRDEVIELAAHG